jgi:diaminopimelate decarboxylase
MWWENDFLRVIENELFLGGRKAKKIAETHGTPLYVYGKNQIVGNFSRLRGLLESLTHLETRICFAMKANNNRSVLKILKSQGAWIDAVSPGEVYEAMRAGFPPTRILFTGTSVSGEDLRKAFSLEGLTVNIDALEQLEIMKEVKERWFKNRRIRVSVRWNPGVGKGFCSRAITAGKFSSDGTPVKFGVEGRKVIEVFEKARRLGFLPVGLHQHLGSGWVKEDYDVIRIAVNRMIHKASELERRSFNLEFLDFGGGFGPKYSKGQGLFPVQKYVEEIGRKIKKAGLKTRAIALEPGKFLLGNAGICLFEVVYVKKSFGNIFVCLNGGTFNTVPRPAIYPEAYHEVVNCSAVNGRNKAKVTIVGNLCETGDVFGKRRRMPLLKRGDILAVLNAGAYCRSMASRFNLRDIPPEIII